MEKFLSVSQILTEGRGRKPPFFICGYLLFSHKLKLVSSPDPSDKPCGCGFTRTLQLSLSIVPSSTTYSLIISHENVAVHRICPITMQVLVCDAGTT
jgi:hypothetical protein